MKNQVFTEDPHLQSPAALHLLRKKLNDELNFLWLKFRNDFLSNTVLTCTYCGKTDLLIETDDLNRLATIDHVIPRSKGGAEFDRSNCVVACFPCNNNRGDMDADEYKRRRCNQNKRGNPSRISEEHA
jgi:5-methylcytosine-specific restriction endonuclease McrA